VHTHSGISGSLGREVALLTALLASLGALFSYGITTSQNHAIILKNEAVMAMLKSTTLRLEARGPRARARILAEQKALDRQAVALNKASARLMGPHDRYAGALVGVETGVALASIAALTERRWLLYLAFVATAFALSMGVLGLMP